MDFMDLQNDLNSVLPGPRDVAILVHHERELDAKDAAVARVKIGKTLVHYNAALGWEMASNLE